MRRPRVPRIGPRVTIASSRLAGYRASTAAQLARYAGISAYKTAYETALARAAAAGLSAEQAAGLAAGQALGFGVGAGAATALVATTANIAQSYFEAMYWTPTFQPGMVGISAWQSVPVIGGIAASWYRSRINELLKNQTYAMIGWPGLNEQLMSALLTPGSQADKQTAIMVSQLLAGRSAPTGSLASQLPYLIAASRGLGLLPMEQTIGQVQGIYGPAVTTAPSALYGTVPLPMLWRGQGVPISMQFGPASPALGAIGTPAGSFAGGVQTVTSTATPGIHAAMGPFITQLAAYGALQDVYAAQQSLTYQIAIEAMTRTFLEQGLSPQEAARRINALRQSMDPTTGLTNNPAFNRVIAESRELVSRVTAPLQEAAMAEARWMQIGLPGPYAPFAGRAALQQQQVEAIRESLREAERTASEAYRQLENLRREAARSPRDPTYAPAIGEAQRKYDEAARIRDQYQAQLGEAEGRGVWLADNLMLSLQMIGMPDRPVVDMAQAFSAQLRAAPGFGVREAARAGLELIRNRQAQARQAAEQFAAVVRGIPTLVPSSLVGTPYGSALIESLQQSATAGVASALVASMSPFISVLAQSQQLQSALAGMPMGYRAWTPGGLEAATADAQNIMQLFADMAQAYRGSMPGVSAAMGRMGLVEFLTNLLPNIRGAYAGSFRAAVRGAELESYKLQTYAGVVPLGADTMSYSEVLTRARRLTQFRRTGYELGVESVQRQIEVLSPLLEANPNDPAIQAAMQNLRGELRYAMDQRDAYIKWGQQADTFANFASVTEALLQQPVRMEQAMRARGGFMQLAQGGMPAELWRRPDFYAQVFGIQRARQQTAVAAGLIEPGSAAYAELESLQYQSLLGGVGALVEGFQGITLPPPARVAQEVLSGMLTRARMFPVVPWNPGVARISLAHLAQARLRAIEQQMEHLPAWQAELEQRFIREGDSPENARRRAQNLLSIAMPEIERLHQQAQTEVVQAVAPMMWEWAMAQPLMAVGAPDRAALLRPSPEGFAEFTWAKYAIPTLGLGFTSERMTELARSMPYDFVRGFTQLPQNFLGSLATEGGVVAEGVQSMVKILGRILELMEGRSSSIDTPITIFPAPRTSVMDQSQIQRQR